MALRETLEQIRRNGPGSNVPSILFNAVQPVLADLGWVDRSQIDLERESDVIVLSASPVGAERPSARPLVFIKMSLSGAPTQRSIDRLREVADRHGTVFLVFTNGQVWWLHLVQHSGDDTDSQFAVVNVRTESVDDVEEALTRYLAKEALVSGTAQHRADEALITRRNNDRLLAAIPQVWRRLLATPESLLVDLVREEVGKTEGLKPTDEQITSVIKRTVVPNPVSGTSTRTATSDTAVDESTRIRRLPTGYQLWGETYKIKRQREILTGVAEAVYRRHADAFDRVLRVSRYFTTDPSTRQVPIPIGSSGYYHEGGMNRDVLERTVGKLLRAFGYSEDDLVVLHSAPIDRDTAPRPALERDAKRPRRRASHRPVGIRLWGMIYPTTRQYQVLTVLAAQLYERHADRFDLALQVTQITKDPSSRADIVPIGSTGYFHKRSLDADRVRSICGKLLTVFGYPPDDLEILYD